MSKSIKLISPSDSLKSVFITYEIGWNNVKLHIRGKVVKTIATRSELSTGINILVNGFGTITVRLNAETQEVSLHVDGEKFKREFNPSDKDKSSIRVQIVFGIQAIMNLVLLMLCVKNHFETPSMINFNFMVLCLSAFFMLSYAVSIIFLRRGMYFFYFFGTGLLTLSTLGVIYTLSQESLINMAIFTVPRLILLIILYTQYKAIRKRIRTEETEHLSELLDEKA